MVNEPDQVQQPETDQAAPKQKSKHKKLLIVSGVIAATIIVAVVAYLLIPAPTPSQAAENYIEDNYDAIAEDLAHAILPDKPITAEIAAEIVESFAEQLAPYSCTQVPGQPADAQLVNVACTITTQIQSPIKLEIEAPFDLTVETDMHSFKAKHNVTSATLNVANTSINNISLNDAERIQNLLALPTKLDIPNLQGLPNPLNK